MKKPNGHSVPIPLRPLIRMLRSKSRVVKIALVTFLSFGLIPNLEGGRVAAHDWEQKQLDSSNRSSEFAPVANMSGIVESIKSIHPLVLATAMVLVVLGVCLLLTENRELELYLKIDFRPPEVDILK